MCVRKVAVTKYNKEEKVVKEEYYTYIAKKASKSGATFVIFDVTYLRILLDV